MGLGFATRTNQCKVWGYATPDLESPQQEWERSFILLGGMKHSKPISEC